MTATLAVGDTSLAVSGGNLSIVLDPSHSVTDSFAIPSTTTPLTLSANPVDDSSVTVTANGQTLSGATATTSNNSTTLSFSIPVTVTYATSTSQPGSPQVDSLTLAPGSDSLTLTQNPTNDSNVSISVNGAPLTTGYTVATAKTSRR